MTRGEGRPEPRVQAPHGGARQRAAGERSQLGCDTIAWSWRCIRCAPARVERWLLLHGLGERSPSSRSARARALAGRSSRSTSRGTAASTIPRGGGYTAEILMATSMPRSRTSAPRHSSAAPRRVRRAAQRGVAAEARARRDPARRPGLAGAARGHGTPQVPMPDPNAVSPPTRSRWSSSPPTCVRPTTRPRSRARRRTSRDSSGRSASARSSAPTGCARSSTSPGSKRARAKRPSPSTRRVAQASTDDGPGFESFTFHARPGRRGTSYTRGRGPAWWSCTRCRVSRRGRAASRRASRTQALRSTRRTCSAAGPARD